MKIISFETVLEGYRPNDAFLSMGLLRTYIKGRLYGVYMGLSIPLSRTITAASSAVSSTTMSQPLKRLEMPGPRIPRRSRRVGAQHLHQSEERHRQQNGISRWRKEDTKEGEHFNQA